MSIKTLLVKEIILWHPDSPGMKVTVYRTFIGSLFKPKYFATLTEVLKNYERRNKAN